MKTLPLAGMLSGLFLIAATPDPLASQQLYECTYTITIKKITTTYADGSVRTDVSYTRTEVCRPI